MFCVIHYSLILDWVYYGLMVVYGVTIVSIICVVLSENRNPVKSLAWVTILLLLPLLGIVLYIFFGRSIKNTAMISRRNRRKLKRREGVSPRVDYRKLELSHESRQLVILGRSVGGSGLYQDNSVKIFTDGAEKLESLLADLRSATTSINLQYYIIADDETGRKVAQVLKERAAAGVKVRVIYDHVGSFRTRSRFFKDLRKAGVEAYPFFKVSFPQLGTKINWRNHRKICIIDDRVGYIGGMNLADRYVHGSSLGKWRDTHLRVEGRFTAALTYSFAVDWAFMGRRLELAEKELPRQSAPESEHTHTAAMQLVTSGPTGQWSNLAFLFLRAIAGAKKRIFIQTPYFLPTEALLKALQQAALAHVDVRLMIPRHTDSRMLTLASASYITECLRAGIKIYFYEGGMLHSKTMIVDDELSTVGSTNFDFRSFEHNFESNAFIYSKEVNRALVNAFMSDLGQSRRVYPDQWRKRSLAQRAAESLVRLLSPIL
ncbi:MAG: cardiolipin synthase [Muribaculaceae bacterium]|nr:cardiolipin synthase [Muribaculaceae bacterium]